MMKKLITLCLLLLFLPIASLAQDGSGSFTWDLSDSSLTHMSSGTGGTERKLKDNYTLDTYIRFDDPFWDANPAYKALMKAWSANARLQLSSSHPPEGDELSEMAYVYDKLLDLRIYTSDASMRCAVFDVDSGRQLALSDLFYDGFNYIDYINTCVAEQMSENTFPWENDWSNGDEAPLALKRPFSGLPNNYPYFLAHLPQYWGNTLAIAHDKSNPFWNTQDLFETIEIPLTHDISPYGDCRIDEMYKRLPKEEDYLVYQPILVIDNGSRPDAQKAIDEALYTMSQRIVDEAEKYAGLSYNYMQPEILQFGKYVCVFFWPMNWEGAWLRLETPIAAGNIFETHTGLPINLEKIVAEWIDRKETRFYHEEFKEGKEAITALETYTLPYGAQITDCWILSQDDSLIIRLVEPDGRFVRMVVPISALILSTEDD